MTTILVTGATGRVGRHVVTGLLEADVTVRALVRTPPSRTVQSPTGLHSSRNLSRSPPQSPTS
ncbi:NmrA family NAD(P)-binding protein [Kribbella alba]|uniref:NmrA family NAD(P)-binding protein n=1 Tax=Kribbella alba TaxID=190197 RepID=UPI0031D59B3D